MKIFYLAEVPFFYLYIKICNSFHPFILLTAASQGQYYFFSHMDS